MEKLKKVFAVSPVKITIFVIAAVIIFFLMKLPFLEFMEFKAADLRMLSRGAIAAGGETVIIAIDEKSIAALGQWPWPRATMARLVNELKNYRTKAIGFDIVFSEPEKNTGLRALQDISQIVLRKGIGDAAFKQLLQDRIKEADADAVLADAIYAAKNVTLGYFFHFTPEDAKHSSPSETAKQRAAITRYKYPLIRMRPNANDAMIPAAYSPVANIQRLSEAGENGGFFNAFPDADGTYRRSVLAVKCDGNYYPSLALGLLLQYLDATPALAIGPAGVEEISIGDLIIPVDESGSLPVNYLGPATTFPHYSAADVIAHRIAPEMLHDKIALVGVTATGVFDQRVTPFSPSFPGVEIHATVIDNMLHQNFLIQSGWTKFIDVCFIAVFGLMMGLVVHKLKAFQGIIAGLFLVAAFLAVNNYVFFRFSIVLNVVYPVLAMMTVYLGVTVYRYVTEEREKKKIRGAFQYYLTASVINEILRDPSKLKLGGDKKDLTVLFSDIRGFTSISEKLAPEELVQLLNEYLTAMTDIVFRYDGLLDKYMGDAIMAVYGAPLAQPDHALRACRTALDMMKALGDLQKQWTLEGRPALNIGIGINSGDMVVGNMGSLMRFDYTVMGDNVNLGSRLEGINKEYGTNIVISESTYQAVKNILYCRELDSVRVKGKAKPVKIYELLGEAGQASTWRDFVDPFETALDLYREQRWDEAVAVFQKVLAARPGDAPTIEYIKRCRELKENPPEAVWDGAYTMTRK